MSYDPHAQDQGAQPLEAAPVEISTAAEESTPRIGPGWDAALQHRAMGTEPGFIGHNESIEAFREREARELEAARALEDQPTNLQPTDIGW